MAPHAAAVDTEPMSWVMNADAGVAVTMRSIAPYLHDQRRTDRRTYNAKETVEIASARGRSANAEVPMAPAIDPVVMPMTTWDRQPRTNEDPARNRPSGRAAVDTRTAR